MASWDTLESELDRWQEAGKVATFWWRDDDLNEPTDAFDLLLDMRRLLDIPLTLAVIPNNVDPRIGADLDGCELVQHGVTHISYAKDGEKKSEFPASRPVAEIIKELASGNDRLAYLFADQFYPVLVPPWNRISDGLFPELKALGYAGISRYKPRKKAMPVAGFAEINTHIDPVFWRGGRTARAESEILSMAVDHLYARRKGHVDAREPTGFLSHHLMFDEALWEVTYKLLSYLKAHRTVRFLTLRGAIALIDEIVHTDDP